MLFRSGDLYLASDAARLEKELRYVRDHADRVYIEEDIYQFTCLDLRHRLAIRRYLSSTYFPDQLLDILQAQVEERTLLYSKKAQPREFTQLCQLNEQRHLSDIYNQYQALVSQGVSGHYVAIAEVPRGNNEQRTGKLLRLHSELHLLQADWATMRQDASECRYPTAEHYICIDLRNRDAVRRHMSEESLDDKQWTGWIAAAVFSAPWTVQDDGEWRMECTQ